METNEQKSQLVNQSAFIPYNVLKKFILFWRSIYCIHITEINMVKNFVFDKKEQLPFSLDSLSQLLQKPNMQD